MVLKFEIIKLFDHHNRGQFIFARQLDFKDQVVVKEGALLNGIPVYHDWEMYPPSKERDASQLDIYVFRPTEVEGYPKGFLQEGQIVELISPE